MALSPMMSYYFTVKEQYKDAIVLFRLGDFYEMFFDDAKEASELLDLTLTGRNCGLEERAPMCGIPYHALDNYLGKLISAGKKVAICEQMNTPEEANGMVDRQVVRVVTPGTIIEDNMLDDKKNNYLASICIDEDKSAISWLDISTGEFLTSQFDNVDKTFIEDFLLTIKPSEIICNESAYNICLGLQSVEMDKLPKFQKYPDFAFNLKYATDILIKQFNVVSLSIFEIDKLKLSICSSGALMNYVLDTQKRSLCHITSIKVFKNNEYLTLDSTAMRNLELVESIRDGSRKATLLYILDATKTSMGARTLKKWIEKPLRDDIEINNRLDAVEELYNNTKIRSNLQEELAKIRDLERLIAKVSYGNPSPRDFLAISKSLEQLPNIKSILSLCKSKKLTNIFNSIELLEDLQNLLSNAIDEDCSALVRDGGFIKAGFNSELDELRAIKDNGKKWLMDLEAKERELTGIKTLKVGYTKVFGYYIEISKGQLDKVPQNYIRKQTLTTGERYITEELKSVEDKLLGSVDRAIRLEIELFNKIKDEIITKIQSILKTSDAIAQLDVLLSFAVVSLKNNYKKPLINAMVDKTEIIEGRHPVVETIIKDHNFIPNNTILDNCTNRTMVITGPNMSGKSTYMRQVALITIMAHIGCFVPAKSAEIAITDRVFTRIGASDDLAFGQSTFMVEMLEVATILRNATYKSLLILDEIGRGTSTFDGLAIARAVIEDISQRVKCKTLFSTHYHELTELEMLLSGIKNYKVLAVERDKGIVFLHKVLPGGTNKSFGIEVAKLAGLPKDVIKRAKDIEKLLESFSISTQKKDVSDQENLLDIATNNTLKDYINNIDIDSLSPLQAFSLIQDLKKMANRE